MRSRRCARSELDASPGRSRLGFCADIPIIAAPFSRAVPGRGLAETCNSHYESHFGHGELSRYDASEMARLFRGYQSSGNGKSILPPFEQFEAKFLEAFGRELTREERRFYRLIEIVLAESVAENATSVSHDGDILNALDMTGKFFDQLKENVSKWEEAAQALDELLPL